MNKIIFRQYWKTALSENPCTNFFSKIFIYRQQTDAISHFAATILRKRHYFTIIFLSPTFKFRHSHLFLAAHF